MEGGIGVESAGFVPPGFSAGSAITHAAGHIAFTSVGR
jgi:hypothetical protein